VVELLRVMDVEVVKLWEIHSREDVVGRFLEKGKMKRSDGGESEAREEFGDSSASRYVRLGKVIEVGNLVKKGSGEFEEGEGRGAEDGEGRSVGVGEDLEEGFRREARGRSVGHRGRGRW
jgi:hypothetical protein